MTVAKAENITLGELLDLWAEEELKTGTLSNGTVGNYLQTIGRIKQHPISKRKLKTVTSVHLQEFMDLLSFGGTVGDFISKGYSIDYVRSFSAVLQQSFRFAVFPKQFITFNPMQYVVMRHKKEETDLFADETATDRDKVKPLSFEMYRKLIEQLGKRSGDAPAYSEILFFKVDILPCQTCYLSKSETCKVCYLNRKNSISLYAGASATMVLPISTKSVRQSGKRSGLLTLAIPSQIF